MSPTLAPPPAAKPSPPSAEVRAATRISSTWIIPVVAIALGLWLVWQHYSDLGPQANIRFETAEGIEAGRTKIRCRSVDVGVVEGVTLSADLQHVNVGIRLTGENEMLLNEDTRFWVVRPRVGGGAISGLGTIISGAYLELDPGRSERQTRGFIGLEDPPATPTGVPGVRIQLSASQGGSLGPGSIVRYRGLEVGRIETRRFDEKTQWLVYDVFIKSPFEKLVTSGSRFWNDSGIAFRAGSGGFNFRAGSLDSILTGGVSFDVPRNGTAGEPIIDGASFRLYDNEDSINDVVLQTSLTYLLMFDASVRGLADNAEVEFRGIRIGSVVGVSLGYANQSGEKRIPVLIEIDPTRLTPGENQDPSQAAARIEKLVSEDGLRATLRTGSLLTGQLFVELDFQPEAPPASVGTLGEYRTLPTTSSSFARIEDQLVRVLTKIRELPIEKTLETATDALGEIKKTAETTTQTVEGLKAPIANLDAILASDDMKQAPAELRDALTEARATLAGIGPDSAVYTDLSLTLQDLQSTLQSIKALSESIDNKPNSLLFGREGSGKDPSPRAPRPLPRR
jgi:paraquat-inducible protein B